MSGPEFMDGGFGGPEFAPTGVVESVAGESVSGATEFAGAGSAEPAFADEDFIAPAGLRGPAGLGSPVSAAGSGVEVGAEAADFGTAAVENGCWPCGPVVMALSGFSRCSRSGPRPKLIRARESGTTFVCQECAAW